MSGEVFETQAAFELLHRRLDKLEEQLEDIARALQTRERVVQGWGAIAAELGYSVSHARKMGRRALYADPIPYYQQRGHAVALVSELRAWQARQSRRPSTARQLVGGRK